MSVLFKQNYLKAASYCLTDCIEYTNIFGEFSADKISAANSAGGAG